MDSVSSDFLFRGGGIMQSGSWDIWMQLVLFCDVITHWYYQTRETRLHIKLEKFVSFDFLTPTTRMMTLGC